MDVAASARGFEELLLTSRWFASTPPTFRKRILDAAVLRRLTAGQQLFARGSLPGGLYCVIEGAISLTRLGKAGKEMLIAHIDPPKWFGEMSLFDCAPSLQQAYAQMPSLVLQVPQPVIEQILNDEPLCWRDLGRLMSQKLRLALLAVEDMALAPAAVRLSRRLLLLADGYGDAQAPRTTFKVQQEQLAMMLSLSRQTANQILNDLEARGALRLSYGEIEILDFDKLRQAAEIPPATAAGGSRGKIVTGQERSAPRSM